MTKRMLIDAAHREETRVAVVDGNRLEEFDYENILRKQLKGSIYLAKITRVEPSLQAAFVDYGGNRHGFLPFTEIHPDYYKIPVADRQALLEEAQRLIEEEEELEDKRARRQNGIPEEHEANSSENDDDGDDGDEDDDDLDEDDEDEDDVTEIGGLDDIHDDADEEDEEDEDQDHNIREIEIVQAAPPEGEDSPEARPEARVENDDSDEDADEAKNDESNEENKDGENDEESPEKGGPSNIAMASDNDSVLVEGEAEDQSKKTPNKAKDKSARQDDSSADASSRDDEAAEGDRADSDEGADGESDDDSKPRRSRRGRGRRRERSSSGSSRRGRNGKRWDRAGNVSRLGGDTGGEELEDLRRRRRELMSRYKIQEVIKRRQIMLIQVSKEERGNKGAAVTTYLSLPGRYCVLMPNTPRGGGISRKISNPADRKRLKEILRELDVPQGMSVILRTAGLERTKAEIKRDLDYLLRLWDRIRQGTLESSAPALIYEEGNLVKRAIRDLYNSEIDEVLVSGDDAYRTAKEFMKMLMPSHAKKVQPYKDENIPLFFRHRVEDQVNSMYETTVPLKSGGYIVINPTEALVSIDVNSGKATRERDIEETALKTNCEAADEIARQCRLRDLGGLLVIDFIDMEDSKNDQIVERRMKEAMKRDRARIQIGRISPFGLLELSRQRLRPSLVEAAYETCSHCQGAGIVPSVESTALKALRAIEEEGIKRKSSHIGVSLPTHVALFILNNKRQMLHDIEIRYGFRVDIRPDDTLADNQHQVERIRDADPIEVGTAAVDTAMLEEIGLMDREEPRSSRRDTTSDEDEDDDQDGNRRKRRRGRRGGRRNRKRQDNDGAAEQELDNDDENSQDSDEDETSEDLTQGDQTETSEDAGEDDNEKPKRNNRRQRRGGNRRGGRRSRSSQDEDNSSQDEDNSEQASSEDNEQRVQNSDKTTDEPTDKTEELDPAAPVSVTEPQEAEPAPMAAQEADAEPVIKDYEKVNEAPEKPKGGWWQRLIKS